MNDKPLGRAVGWFLKNKTILFQNLWIRLRQDTVNLNGKEIQYTYVEHPGSVFIVPLTERNEVVMIKIYRYTVDAWCWEIPAGGIGDKGGKNLEEIAKDELEEEAGYTSDSFELMNWYYTGNGMMALKASFFIARKVRKLPSNKAEETEQIAEVRAFPLHEAVRMVLSGEIRDGESAFAILLTQNALAHPLKI